MDRVELDDALLALNKTFKYYGKQLDHDQLAFWRHWLIKQDVDAVKRALVEHVDKSQFAPKISNLTDLIANQKQAEQSIYQEGRALPVATCPELITRAWLYWLPEFHGSAIGGIMGRVSGVTAEEAEEMLLLINREAKRTNEPTAIPEDYRLAEVWGE